MQWYERVLFAFDKNTSAQTPSGSKSIIGKITNETLFQLLVAHSATQYMSLSVLSLCLSVATFQINSPVLPNAFIKFTMASKWFQMVPEESMHKILKFPEHSVSFNKLPRVLNQLNGSF